MSQGSARIFQGLGYATCKTLPLLVFCLARWRCLRSFLSRHSLADVRRLCEFARLMTCQQVDSADGLSMSACFASDLQGLGLPQL